MKRILPLFLLLLLTACSQRRGVVTVKVIATSDVHGCFFETDLLDGKAREGSLARFSAFLKNERQNGNVVYVDCGDMLQGSVEVYQDLTSEYYKPSLAAQIYNYLGCDAVALGNHDIAIGANSYERFFNAAEFSILGTNVYFDDYGDYLPPYEIVERHGVRIGLLGLTTESADRTVPSDVLGELGIHDLEEAARHWVDFLQDKTDVVIAMVHSGLQDAEKVASVPGIDAVLFGHDHVRYCSTVGSVPVVNPGHNAEYASVATLTVDFTKGDSPSVSVSGENVSLSGMAPDPEFQKVLADRYDIVKSYSDSIIGKASVPFESGCALWRPASALDYIHSIQIKFFGAQVSLAAPVAGVSVIEASPMYMRDVFRLYPYDNSMVSVMMKGSEIRQALEYSASLFYNTVGKGTEHLLKMTSDGRPENAATGFITACGIDYTVDVTAQPGKRVKVISFSDGTPFADDGSYRTTINSYLFAGTDSPLLKALGMTSGEMAGRLNSSSMSDIRFYVITNFSLYNEAGQAVTVPSYGNWKLVPEKLVDGFLATDTVNFKFIEQ